MIFGGKHKVLGAPEAQHTVKMNICHYINPLTDCVYTKTDFFATFGLSGKTGGKVPEQGATWAVGKSAIEGGLVYPGFVP